MVIEKRAKQLLVWECKQCHQLIPDSETVAYHLIDGVLYGWCQACFVITCKNSKRKIAEA